MMISVNLRPGAKRGRAAPSLGLNLGALKGLGERFKNPLPALALVAWVGAIGFLGWTFVRTGSQLGTLEPQLESTRAEHHRFEDFVRQKRREEAGRDSILAQIRTIQQVDGDRYVWPHILDEVARALPAFTWLVDVSPAPPPAVPDTTSSAAPPVNVQITGRTVDIQGYTRFMRRLEDSPWLGNVVAISASTVVEQGRAVTAFVVQATFTPADSSYVRTVPISQSVVR
jgi:Tfp pilus assembly protein PilN